MTGQYLQALTVSLGLTLLIECGAAWLCRIRGQNLLMVALMNVMTNPALVTIRFFTIRMTAIPEILLIAVLEIAVVMVEAACLKDRVKKPILMSLLLNGLSFGIGLLL